MSSRFNSISPIRRPLHTEIPCGGRGAISRRSVRLAATAADPQVLKRSALPDPQANADFYADAAVPSRFSLGLGPADLSRTTFCSRSNQNGAPNNVAAAVISQPKTNSSQ
jgi:hypothetical protein